VPLGVVMGITFTPPVWIPFPVSVALASLVGALLQAKVKTAKAKVSTITENELLFFILKLAFLIKTRLFLLRIVVADVPDG
jgi:hypothetical protein